MNKQWWIPLALFVCLACPQLFAAVAAVAVMVALLAGGSWGIMRLWNELWSRMPSTSVPALPPQQAYQREADPREIMLAAYHRDLDLIEQMLTDKDEIEVAKQQITDKYLQKLSRL